MFSLVLCERRLECKFMLQYKQLGWGLNRIIRIQIDDGDDDDGGDGDDDDDDDECLNMTGKLVLFFPKDKNYFLIETGAVKGRNPAFR